MTTILTQGESVGVAHQYCGALGKQANCQSLVSLTLAHDDVPIPLVLRLYLPEAWARDTERRKKVGVPDAIGFRPKWRIALDEVQRLVDSGVRFGTVLADAGYGVCAEFRQTLTQMPVQWAVGIGPEQKFYPAKAGIRMPRPAPTGPRRKRPLPTHARRSARELMARLDPTKWRRLTWRVGTKGPLQAEFSAIRVRTAGVHLPGDEAWLVAERRSSEEIKYYVTNHPSNTKLKALAGAIKARWACEQALTQQERLREDKAAA